MAFQADRNRVTAVGVLGASRMVTGGREGVLKVWNLGADPLVAWTSTTAVKCHDGGVAALDDGWNSAVRAPRRAHVAAALGCFDEWAGRPTATCGAVCKVPSLVHLCFPHFSSELTKNK